MALTDFPSLLPLLLAVAMGTLRAGPAESGASSAEGDEEGATATLDADDDDLGGGAGEEEDDDESAADDVAAAGKRFLAATDEGEGAGAAEDDETDEERVAREKEEAEDDTDEERDAREKEAAAAKGGTEERPAKKKGADDFKKVTLTGLKDRGEEDIEVEVDAELADRITRLQKDGIRRGQYNSRVAKLEEREAHFDGLELEAEQDPVGFILEKVPKAHQLAVARALLVEHYEELAQDIERYEGDQSERYKAQTKLRDDLKTSGKRLETATAARAAARACLRTTDALIPDDTDEGKHTKFMKMARAELADAADRGEDVSPATVPKILKELVTLYGFDRVPAKKKAATTPAAGASGDRARPVSEKAREIADRRVTKAGAQAAEARIRRSRQARAGAERIAPAGAGSSPARAALKESEETDVLTASRALRKKGLPQTWKTPAE